MFDEWSDLICHLIKRFQDFILALHICMKYIMVYEMQDLLFNLSDSGAMTSF